MFESRAGLHEDVRRLLDALRELGEGRYAALFDAKEVLLQSAIYCGVPAAIDSFRSAKEVFKEMGI